MKSPCGRELETNVVYGPCKDFLCPIETKLREWFPSQLAGKLRAKALDPYGLMKSNIHGNKDGELFAITYKCQDVRCHAKFILRNVLPDAEGNSFGIFGCNSHQHDLPMANKSEIVFKDKPEAEQFIKANFYKLYGKGISMNKGKYRQFPCRRKQLQPGYGFHDCTSCFAMSPTFKRTVIKGKSKIYEGSDKDLEALSFEERPHSISGVFYHNHVDDSKYWRDLDGGWKKQGSYGDPSKRKRGTPLPRIRNGRIFPLSARKTHTIEELMVAQERRRQDNKTWIQKPKKKKTNVKCEVNVVSN